MMRDLARVLFGLALFALAYAFLARPLLLESLIFREMLYVTGIALVARHGVIVGAMQRWRGSRRRPDFGDAP